MQYMLLIYQDEAKRSEAYAAMSTRGPGSSMGDWFTYTEELQNAGVHVAGDALLPSATASTVRVRGGETSITDGPFAETREQLGGYYLLDVDSLEEAQRWAAKIPGGTSPPSRCGR